MLFAIDLHGAVGQDIGHAQGFHAVLLLKLFYVVLLGVAQVEVHLHKERAIAMGLLKIYMGLRNLQGGKMGRPLTHLTTAS